LKQIDLDRLKKTQGFVKLRQLYKKNTLLEESKKKNDKSNNKNIKNESMSDESSDDNEEEELELDYMLETNLHRKLRNMNLQIEKENKLKTKLLKERGDTANEDSIEKNIREKNKKLLDLFKDDEKLYFKGASQYVLNKKKYNDKSIGAYSKLIINNNNKNLRSISALPIPRTKKNSNFHNIIEFNKYPDIQRKYNSLRFHKNHQLTNRLKRPLSMMPLSEENIYKNDLIKKLDIKFQIKKQNMDKIFNKEKNSSLLSDFYRMIAEKDYNKLMDNPFYLGKNSEISEKGKTIRDKDLDNKLEYLKKVIRMDFKEGIWASGNSTNNEKEINEYKDIKKVLRKKRKKKQEDRNKMKHNDDEVIIDGVKYNTNDIRTIADAIFTKCGYIHKKIV
jgi:hypothetical protein